MKQYGDAKTPDQYMTEFMLSNQGEESFDEFYDKLAELARKAFIEMTPREANRILKSRLESALRRRTLN